MDGGLHGRLRLRLGDRTCCRLLIGINDGWRRTCWLSVYIFDLFSQEFIL